MCPRDKFIDYFCLISYVTLEIFSASFTLAHLGAPIVLVVVPPVLVASAVVDTFRELYFLFRAHQHEKEFITNIKKNKALKVQDINIAIHQQYARIKYLKIKHRDEAIVHALTSLFVLAVIITLISFPPAGLVAVAGMFTLKAVAMGLIFCAYGMNVVTRKYLEKAHNKDLEADLKDTRQAYAYKVVPQDNKRLENVKSMKNDNKLAVNTLNLYYDAQKQKIIYKINEGEKKKDEKIITGEITSKTLPKNLNPAEKYHLRLIVQALEQKSKYPNRPARAFYPGEVKLLEKLTGFFLKKPESDHTMDPLKSASQHNSKSHN